MKENSIPFIAGDAFRNRTAVEIIPSGEAGCNDHCLFQDAEGRWHCIGIINAPKTLGEKFFHGVAETPVQPMKILDPIYETREGERTCWAPCNVVVGDTIHFFWTDAAGYFGPLTQKEGDKFVFHQHHASAPLLDLKNWTHHGIIFKEEGGARDLEVVRVGDQWMMIYCRRNDPGTQLGESVVSYRFSKDLFKWSKREGDLVRGLADVQWAGSSESPFLLKREQGWYLFVTHVGPGHYHRTKVWFSNDPTNFGTDEDHMAMLFTHAAQIIEYDGKTWITNTGCHSPYYQVDFPDNIGVEVAELQWIS